MFEAGFVDEVRRLLDAGLARGRTAATAIGYREVAAYLAGETTLDEAVEATTRATRRFSRRQDSWFRKDPRVVWVPWDDPDRGRDGAEPLVAADHTGGVSYAFLKGHGTENDFVLLPDHDGSVHGDLSADGSRALCDRRAGIGADGVLRVVRPRASDADGPASAEWFMDYRNADGSVAEMCGNGIRVFALHLYDEGLVRRGPPGRGSRPGPA